MTSGSSVFVLLWLILAVLWLVVPFAIFAIKKLLKEILAEQRRTNELLARGSATSEPGTHVDIPEFRPKGGFFGG
jgi:predicted Holliday junction resolvase-like endonuclease